jgi:crotonobetainyl-CoA:carnitine CoA-transferase CaiB-like acyl-CoA transferase
MSLPLDGIRIIDWTVGQFGPVATSMLGDLGADVIKLEQPVKGDPGRGMQTIMGRSATGLPEGRNYYFENNNRSKRGITVDVTKEEGQEIVYRMVKTADVFVCNLRQHVAPKVGLDYKTLSKYNPKLIYATANAFGPDGPDSDKPGVDYVAAARSGLMTSVGEPGMPPLVTQGGIVDQSGAVFLGYSIVIALLARERLGIGQEVNVSLLGSSITQYRGLMLRLTPFSALKLASTIGPGWEILSGTTINAPMVSGWPLPCYGQTGAGPTSAG